MLPGKCFYYYSSINIGSENGRKFKISRLVSIGLFSYEFPVVPHNIFEKFKQFSFIEAQIYS